MHRLRLAVCMLSHETSLNCDTVRAGSEFFGVASPIGGWDTSHHTRTLVTALCRLCNNPIKDPVLRGCSNHESHMFHSCAGSQWILARYLRSRQGPRFASRAFRDSSIHMRVTYEMFFYS